MEYRQYLQQQGYSETTITGNLRQVELFKKWCKRHGTAPEQVDYNMCMKFIKHLTRKGNAKKTINHKLRNIKTYFDHLIGEAYRADNPIEGTIVKGEKRTIAHDLLETDELEDLFYSFESDNATDKYALICAKRNKVITGLIVHQGLGTTDLGNLKTEYLKLSKGKIYVPSTKRSNARELELRPWQIMGLMKYQNEVLPLLQERTGNSTDQFFPTGTRFSVTTSQIIKKLKKYNQKVRDIKQLRASVITNWLGQHNLRKVQYMAGHRYISSTERYLTDDLENLHEMVNSFHPIS